MIMTLIIMISIVNHRTFVPRDFAASRCPPLLRAALHSSGQPPGLALPAPGYSSSNNNNNNSNNK